MEPNRWKLIAGGAALVVATGACADDGFDVNDLGGDVTETTNAGADFDGSPESADSPNESIQESPDSPNDSPDDAGYVDPSPESADSPNESIEDSPDPAPAPAPPPTADDSPASPDSPDGNDS